MLVFLCCRICLCLLHRILGLDLVVRDDAGNTLDPERTSTVSLFRAHESASHSIDERIQEEKVKHLFLCIIKIYMLVLGFFFLFSCMLKPGFRIST